MKITQVQASATAERRTQPIRDALQWLDARGHYHITIETDEGIRGTSSTYFGRVVQAPKVLAHLVNDAFNIPYASHGGGIHLHVLAALPNTLFMESGILPDGSPIKLLDGCYPLPEEPGFGFT